MKATDQLKNEHQGIGRMLRVLRSVSDRLERGQPVPAEHLDGIMEFLSIFVDRCHHGKEEEFLFPALEAAGVAKEGGPIGVMLSEHAEGRALVRELRAALGRFRAGERTAASEFRTTAEAYADLLSRHIEKENQVLFAMADAKLSVARDAELFKAFERLERDRIGAGKHEEFHALLHRLEGAYPD